MWRYAVITLLREAARAGVLDTDLSRPALLQLLTSQYERWWNIDIKRFRSKRQFLGYAGVRDGIEMALDVDVIVDVDAGLAPFGVDEALGW